jgi:hypothetical protein
MKSVQDLGLSRPAVRLTVARPWGEAHESVECSATEKSVWPTILADSCAPESRSGSFDRVEIFEIWVTSIKACQIFKISSPLDRAQVTYVTLHGPIYRGARLPVGRPVDTANELGTCTRAKAHET